MCYEEDARALGLEKTEEVEIIPGVDHLITIHEKCTRGPFQWEDLGALTAYLQKESITVYGDAFCHIMASKTIDGAMVNYHRVFLKVYS